jgi:ferredoxin-NADP reductase
MAIPGESSGTTVIRMPRPSRWQPARVVDIRRETHRVKTIRFEVADWPGHLPGQHADVRLRADDGYRAERSYSIASPPAVPRVELTVDRLEDGEVSPYLTEHLRVGDALELRGPIGRYFVWAPDDSASPLLLLAGGSGIVPLMCMLRHRQLSKRTVPAGLLYSCRTREDVVYYDELMALADGDPGFTLRITLTREQSSGWTGRRGRIDLPAVQSLLERLGGAADSFVCGSDGFVETAAALLLQAGQAQATVRTERFGPTRG